MTNIERIAFIPKLFHTFLRFPLHDESKNKV